MRYLTELLGSQTTAADVQKLETQRPTKQTPNAEIREHSRVLRKVKFGEGHRPRHEHLDQRVFSQLVAFDETQFRDHTRAVGEQNNVLIREFVSVVYAQFTHVYEPRKLAVRDVAENQAVAQIELSETVETGIYEVLEVIVS